MTNQETRSHKENTSSYVSNIFSLAGTVFLWIMFPSFNAARTVTAVSQLRAVINTFLAITASVLSSFLMSRFVSEDKFDIIHVQSSTLTGGISMGVAAHLNLQPAGAIGIGFIAGLLSVWGFKFLTPFMSRRYHIQDVAGVHNLHGMPGVLSCLVGIFACINAYRNQSQFYPNDFTILFPQGTLQAGFQTAGLFITLGIALVGGTFTGFLMSAVISKGTFRKNHYFTDRRFWTLPSDYNAGALPPKADIELKTLA